MQKAPFKGALERDIINRVLVIWERGQKMNRYRLLIRETNDIAMTIYQKRYPNFASRVFISTSVLVFRPVKLVKSFPLQTTIILVA